VSVPTQSQIEIEMTTDTWAFGPIRGTQQKPVRGTPQK